MGGLMQRFCRDEAGTTLVEFAVVGPVFIFCALAVMDLANGFYMKNRLDYAADRITRQVMIDPDLTVNTVELPAALDGYDLDLLELTITPVTVGDNEYRDIVISYPFSFVSSQLSLGGPSMSVTRTVYING